MKRILNSLSRTIYNPWLTSFFAVLTIVIASQAFANTAYADSLTVAVKQNPNGTAKTVTCTLLQKNCDLSLVINAGTATEQSLKVHVVYLDSGLALNFQTAGGYFSTATTIGTTVVYTPLWSRGLQGNTSTFTAALFQPLAPTPMTPIAPDAHYTSVANLEITATSGP